MTRRPSPQPGGPCWRASVRVVTIGTSIEGAGDRALGQLYGVLGRIEDADHHYESAWRLEDAMGYGPLAARSRYWHARLLTESGHPDDRRRASNLLRTARTVTHEAGMPLLHQQASRLYSLL